MDRFKSPFVPRLGCGWGKFLSAIFLFPHFYQILKRRKKRALQIFMVLLRISYTDFYFFYNTFSPLFSISYPFILFFILLNIVLWINYIICVRISFITFYIFFSLFNILSTLFYIFLTIALLIVKQL